MLAAAAAEGVGRNDPAVQSLVEELQAKYWTSTAGIIGKDAAEQYKDFVRLTPVVGVVNDAAGYLALGPNAMTPEQEFQLVRSSGIQPFRTPSTVGRTRQQSIGRRCFGKRRASSPRRNWRFSRPSPNSTASGKPAISFIKPVGEGEVHVVQAVRSILRGQFTGSVLTSYPRRGGAFLLCDLPTSRPLSRVQINGPVLAQNNLSMLSAEAAEPGREVDCNHCIPRESFAAGVSSARW